MEGLRRGNALANTGFEIDHFKFQSDARNPRWGKAVPLS
jgi:hypothetical protein